MSETRTRDDKFLHQTQVLCLTRNENVMHGTQLLIAVHLLTKENIANEQAL